MVKNGIIKKYYEGKLVFEGELLNGEKNGKGKEYNSSGILDFEGEYKDGKRCKGKEYFSDGIVMYDGGYFNEKHNGKAKE